MTDLSRRQVVGLLAGAPLAVALGVSPGRVERALRDAQALIASGRRYDPRFFTPHEWATVRILADLVIPRDERSGSATDAAVPEYMDYLLAEEPDSQRWMRDGLGWLDAECRRRFSKAFLECAGSDRTALLDDIAWPARARPEMKEGVEFFNRFRDLTAAGFWSSKAGVEDLQYQGNTVVPEWTGCPPEALKKLGVRYGDG